MIKCVYSEVGKKDGRHYRATGWIDRGKLRQPVTIALHSNQVRPEYKSAALTHLLLVKFVKDIYLFEVRVGIMVSFQEA